MVLVTETRKKEELVVCRAEMWGLGVVRWLKDSAHVLFPGR